MQSYRSISGVVKGSKQETICRNFGDSVAWKMRDCECLCLLKHTKPFLRGPAELCFSLPTN